ncbi:hypothetical protein A3K63_03740 [Candidatus Micrarchaeota archaeon RBG_16_49_10]|nr:MAG: hypothetical protein A3K63_03740 [Candidatus Micrarchaeota archaeon RBG_16_49_10]
MVEFDRDCSIGEWYLENGVNYVDVIEIAKKYGIEASVKCAPSAVAMLMEKLLREEGREIQLNIEPCGIAHILEKKGNPTITHVWQPFYDYTKRGDFHGHAMGPAYETINLGNEWGKILFKKLNGHFSEADNQMNGDVKLYSKELYPLRNF